MPQKVIAWSTILRPTLKVIWKVLC